MARVKRGVTSRAKHKKVLKAVKGQWRKQLKKAREYRDYNDIFFFECSILNSIFSIIMD